MDLDSRLVDYMQKRAEFAKLVATAIAVQCFVLAVFFSAYGLVFTQFVYSDSMDLAKLIIVCAVIVISFILCAFNVLICVRHVKTTDKPDYIGIRQSRETVLEAYSMARGVLVFDITVSVAVMLSSGIIYILLQIFLDRSFMAGIYGRICVCALLAIALYKAIPAIDRIVSYMELCGQIHIIGDGNENLWHPYAYAIAIGMPLSICGWYILRYFVKEYNEIAWIVFPVAALFLFSIAFLISWNKRDKDNN